MRQLQRRANPSAGQGEEVSRNDLPQRELIIHYLALAEGFGAIAGQRPSAGYTLLLAVKRSAAVKKARVVVGGIAAQN